MKNNKNKNNEKKSQVVQKDVNPDGTLGDEEDFDDDSTCGAQCWKLIK